MNWWHYAGCVIQNRHRVEVLGRKRQFFYVCPYCKKLVEV